MPNSICLNPAYTIEKIQPDTVFFVSERKSVSFQNSLYYRLVELIDGNHNVDQIIDIMQEELIEQNNLPEQNPAVIFQSIVNLSIQIQKALFDLEKQGYIFEVKEQLPDNLAILCHHLDIEQHQACERLNQTTVAIKTFGNFDSLSFQKTLESLHIKVTDDKDNADLTIVLTDDYLRPELSEFNKKALAKQKKWLLIKPVGTVTWIGPLLKPNETACWHCFAQRWRNNRPVEEFIVRQNQQEQFISSPIGYAQATIETTLGMAAMEIFKWIIQGGKNPAIDGQLMSFDTIHQQIQSHTVVKLPQCQSCGYTLDRPLPVVLGHNLKQYTEDGGHRSCTPQETVAKYQHHISQITGVIRELTKISSNPLLHTYIAKHHYRNVFDNLDNLRRNIGGRSGGKGGNDAQAKASGFCEAIERYSGVYQGYEIKHKASYKELGLQAIHPNDCMGFSELQYQQRHQWNEKCQGWFQKVPEPFDESQTIDWTPVWSFTANVFKYVPTVYCYYGYPQTTALDCWSDSNGCASGNTMEEAILQGFMELVERDAVALWWYNRLSKPQVDIASFNDPYFNKLREYYHNIDRDLWVLDITSDLNIPCFAAISSQKNHETEDIVLGYGAHFDAKIALSRALTEVNQILPNVLSYDDDGKTVYPPSADTLALQWWQEATLANQPYLVPDSNLPKKTIGDYAPVANDDLYDDVKLCQKIVEDQGMELLVLDQTRPDIGLRVAKVIVPGLRHMWKRLGDGRLYDVPVKMGWLDKPLTEEELNPFPMWM